MNESTQLPERIYPMANQMRRFALMAVFAALIFGAMWWLR